MSDNKQTSDTLLAALQSIESINHAFPLRLMKAANECIEIARNAIQQHEIEKHPATDAAREAVCEEIMDLHRDWSADTRRPDFETMFHVRAKMAVWCEQLWAANKADAEAAGCEVDEDGVWF